MSFAWSSDLSSSHSTRWEFWQPVPVSFGSVGRNSRVEGPKYIKGGRLAAFKCAQILVHSYGRLVSLFSGSLFSHQPRVACFFGKQGSSWVIYLVGQIIMLLPSHVGRPSELETQMTERTRGRREEPRKVCNIEDSFEDRHHRIDC
jgi:hypothetical protein